MLLAKPAEKPLPSGPRLVFCHPGEPHRTGVAHGADRQTDGHLCCSQLRSLACWSASVAWPWVLGRTLENENFGFGEAARPGSIPNPARGLED